MNSLCTGIRTVGNKEWKKPGRTDLPGQWVGTQVLVYSGWLVALCLQSMERSLWAKCCGLNACLNAADVNFA